MEKIDQNSPNRILGTSLVVQWLRLHTPKAGGPSSVPSQGIRSHMLQLRVHMLQLKNVQHTANNKGPHAATETGTATSSINQYFFKLHTKHVHFSALIGNATNFKFLLRYYLRDAADFCKIKPFILRKLETYM